MDIGITYTRPQIKTDRSLDLSICRVHITRVGGTDPPRRFREMRDVYTAINQKKIQYLEDVLAMNRDQRMDFWMLRWRGFVQISNRETITRTAAGDDWYRNSYLPVVAK